MIDDLTHRLHNDLGMHWKPKSLQIMSAAHMYRYHRSKITARGSERHRFPLELCRSMKVLGSGWRQLRSSIGLPGEMVRSSNMQGC